MIRVMVSVGGVLFAAEVEPPLFFSYPDPGDLRNAPSLEWLLFRIRL